MARTEREDVMKDTISTTAEDGTVYEFEKPEFECELKHIDNDYIYAKLMVGGIDFVVMYNLEGGVVSSGGATRAYNLTPIKKQWYKDKEILSKENPKLIVIIETGVKLWAYGYDRECFEVLEEFYEQGFIDEKKVRLANKEEVLSLYYQDKEK